MGRTEAVARRALSLLLPVLLCLGFAACASPSGPETTPIPAATAPASTPSPAPEPTPSPTPTPGPTPEPPPAGVLTLACPVQDRACSPLETGAGRGQLLLELTQAPLLSMLPDGSFSPTPEGGGAAGLRVAERGDGRAALRITLREDVRFSDGSYADADDMLLTLYVLLHPDYRGGLRLRDCAIAGLEEYRTGMSTALLEQYASLYPQALAGEGELSDMAAEALTRAWEQTLQELTERCRNSYLETYASFALGLSPETAAEDEGALRAFCLWCAGLAAPADDRGVMTDTRGQSWNPGAGQTPDHAALRASFTAAYGSAEGVDAALGTEICRLAREEFLRSCAAGEEENAAPAGIPGVSKVDDYTVELLLDAFTPADLARLGELWLLPSAVLGGKELFDPDTGCLTGETGALASMLSDRDQPLPGAGPFILLPGEDELRLEANPWYFGGEPKIGELRLLEGEDPLDLFAAGEADLALLPATPESLEKAWETGELRLLPGEICGYLELSPSLTEGAEGEPSLARAILDLAAACCRASAREYFGDAALVPEDGIGEEKALEALAAQLGALPEEDGTITLLAFVSGGGKGDHPCVAGLQRCAELLASLDLTLSVTDAASDGAFWTAVDAGEASLWAAAAPLGQLNCGERALVYRRLVLLAADPRRVKAASLPEELTPAWELPSALAALEPLEPEE